MSNRVAIVSTSLTASSNRGTPRTCDNSGSVPHVQQCPLRNAFRCMDPDGGSNIDCSSVIFPLYKDSFNQNVF